MVIKEPKLEGKEIVAFGRDMILAKALVYRHYGFSNSFIAKTFKISESTLRKIFSSSDENMNKIMHSGRYELKSK